MELCGAMSVLLVDDNTTMHRILRRQLAELGVTDVDTAPDGATALHRLAERSYDLVISDWNMQPMSGYDLLCRVRAGDCRRDLPFLMVTAESKTDFIMAALRAGASSYLVKPFTKGTLRAKIETLRAA